MIQSLGMAQQVQTQGVCLTAKHYANSRDFAMKFKTNKEKIL